VLIRPLVPLVLAGLALTGCAGSSSAPTASSPVPTPVLASDQPTQVASAVASDTAQQTIALTVSGGKVTGQTGRVKVALGTRLRITVTADVADEVHVHVYDLKQEISANAPASIEFVANKPGQIEVELEKAKLTLTRLLIS
jgi:hypothetical protein